MTFHFLGPDPVETQIEAILERIAGGEAPSLLERTQVDVKEEPGRRAAGGDISEGQAENEAAAQYLANEMACMANTPGGGGIILGIANDGRRIGTNLDAEWLRHRIWQLTDKRLTIVAREAMFESVRILVLIVDHAIEPIPYQGRTKWRLNDNCVDIDATSWHGRRLRTLGYDWSAQPSGHTLDDVSAVAREVARRYLHLAAAAGDATASDLREASDSDLLRRLNLVDGSGRLTNAGSLLFVATPSVGVDYIRRDEPAGDSTSRIRTQRSLLEQVAEVEQAFDASNRIVHVADGFAHAQLRAIPARALREAIINGVVHRDWLSPSPTVVEHVGDAVTITSPGGFVGGIDSSNIITHPSLPRHKSLCEAAATLRIAEREGVGVDRMIQDMLTLGHPRPEIFEIAGPYVRVVLIGGAPDDQVLSLLAAVRPAPLASNIDVLLIIHQLMMRGWIDVEHATPTLQRSRSETTAALARLANATIGGNSIIVPVEGVPTDAPAAYRLSSAAKEYVPKHIAHLSSASGRKKLIADWAACRGRVSSKEVADLTGLSPQHAGAVVLSELEAEGLLKPGRESRIGRGFFYLPGDKKNNA